MTKKFGSRGWNCKVNNTPEAYLERLYAQREYYKALLRFGMEDYYYSKLKKPKVRMNERAYKRRQEMLMAIEQQIEDVKAILIEVGIE